MDNETLKRYVASSEPLKAGDSVRVKPFEDAFGSSWLYYNEHMKELSRGEAVFKVDRVEEDGTIHAKGFGYYAWLPEWVEKV